MIRNDNKGEKVMNYIELLSVGCLLTKDLKVFPINCNEVPETASEADEYMGVHIYDLTDEWFCNLSSDDLNGFFDFLELVNSDNMVMSVYNEWKTDIWSKWEDVNNCFMNLELNTIGEA